MGSNQKTEYINSMQFYTVRGMARRRFQEDFVDMRLIKVRGKDKSLVDGCMLILHNVNDEKNLEHIDFLEKLIGEKLHLFTPMQVEMKGKKYALLKNTL